MLRCSNSHILSWCKTSYPLRSVQPVPHKIFYRTTKRPTKASPKKIFGSSRTGLDNLTKEQVDDTIQESLERELRYGEFAGEVKEIDMMEQFGKDEVVAIKNWRNCGLRERMARAAVLNLDFRTPTEIQKHVIPLASKRYDVIASAETGTGKTAAYAFPILNNLIPRRLTELKNEYDRIEPMALIITPTKELAEQVTNHITQYISVATTRTTDPSLHVRVRSVIGGVSRITQMAVIRKGVDILVATPGRLLEILKGEHGPRLDANDPLRYDTKGRQLDLSKIEYFVVDECDRMLNMGFIADIKDLYSYLPRPNKNKEADVAQDFYIPQSRMQVMMFSATLSRGVEDLMMRFAPNHKLVNLNASMQVAPGIKHIQYVVSSILKKYSLLNYLLHRREFRRCQILIFARTRQKCDRLAERLNKSGQYAYAIHKGCSVADRSRAIQNFKDLNKIIPEEEHNNNHAYRRPRGDSGEVRPDDPVRILISTDVLARGIDVPDLPVVINYDVPNVPEDYVHRVGRTGRAGRSGKALLFVSAAPQIINLHHRKVEINELQQVQNIERFIRQRIERRKVPGKWYDNELQMVLNGNTTQNGIDASKRLPTVVEQAFKDSRSLGVEILSRKQEKFKKEIQSVRRKG
ncbi:DEAD box RNA helicase [Acrasis kona]|uniref:DEAD box RNA helicase n=1 Tax=Acrasis kona TaxID=1008807 RepID=A0AAW2YRJ2_9EUKA